MRLALDSRLEVNSEEVVAQVIEGEAIIINLANGMYYSMDAIGGEVWSLIEEGRSLAEIATAVSEAYEVEAERTGKDLRRLARALIDEKLVRISPDTAPVTRLPASVANGGHDYRAPELHSYRDMADLLALDPPMPGIRSTPWDAPDPRGPDDDR